LRYERVEKQLVPALLLKLLNRLIFNIDNNRLCDSMKILANLEYLECYGA